MKRLLMLLSLLLGALHVCIAQTKISTAPQSFHITRKGRPAVLDVVPGSVQFADQNKNNVIDADEECFVSMVVQNMGEGDANGCMARVRADGAVKGLSYKNMNLPVIAHNQQHEIKIPIKASHDIESGLVHLTVEVTEPHGLGTSPISLDIPTQAFLPPCVEVVSHQVLTVNQTKLTKKMPFRLRVVVQNTQQGVAEQVEIELREPKDVLLTSGNAHASIPQLRPNESYTLDFDLISTINAADDIPFEIALSEKHGRYAHNKTIDLHIGQPTGVQEAYTIQGYLHKDVEIKRVSLVSDVDENIPVSNMQNNNMFVLIVANENYDYLDKVNFAINDGLTFEKYCRYVLGVPENHIFFYKNATSGNLVDGISKMRYALDNFENSRAIVYYCGHGIPDEKSNQAYLIPVDGKGTNTATCYSLNKLYMTLAETKAKSITYFMDACFTGTTKEGSMLVAARGVARAPEKEMLAGETIVFSASSGDETAMTYKEKQHGLFTYYLLKKLQETEGDVTYGDLAEYISQNVKNDAFLINEKPQNPIVATSPAAANSWSLMRLK